MSELTEFKADTLAETYLNIFGAEDMRRFRKTVLEGILKNLMHDLEVSAMAIPSTYDRYKRLWNAFIQNVDDGINEELKRYGLDWDIEADRRLTLKQQEKTINFRIDNITRLSNPKGKYPSDVLLLLFFKYITVKRDDFDTLMRKVDEVAYKWWKNEITAQEFLSIQAELTNKAN